MGFSDTPHAIKGHRVWLPDLVRIVVAKDVRFSELEQLETNAAPSHTPVLASNRMLLHSYTWLPPNDEFEASELNDTTAPSLLPYSCQCSSSLQSDSPDLSSYDREWDCMMAEIEATGEIVVDLDVIAADLEAELDAASSEEGNTLHNTTQAADPESTSLLDTPRSDTVANVYDDVSVLELARTGSSDQLDLPGYTAFAATCSETMALTIGSHHLERMAFAVTVMNGTALVASGQQLRSADGILLEPLSLSEAKSHDDWDKWQEAMESKMNSMSKMDVFELVNIPADGKLIGIRWVYKLKLDAQQWATRYKACLVAQGYAQQQGLDYDQTFSPVMHLQTICMLLALTRKYGMYVSWG